MVFFKQKFLSLFVLCALFAHSNSYSLATAVVEDTSTVSSQAKGKETVLSEGEQRDKLIKDACEQIRLLQFCASELGMDFGRGIIKIEDIDIKNVKTNLTLVQQACGSIEQSLDITLRKVDVVDVYRACLILGMLTDYLLDNIKNNFSAMQKLDFSSLVKLDTPPKITPEAVTELIEKLTTKIKNISDKTPYIGINWFHRGFRRLEALDEKLHLVDIGTGLSAAAGVTIASIYLMQKFDENEGRLKFLKKGYNNAKDIIGTPPTCTFNADGTLLAHGGAGLGRLDQVLRPIGHSIATKALGVPGLLLTPTLPILSRCYKKTWNYAKKQGRALHEFLHGGPLTNRKQNIRTIESGGLDQIIGNEEAKRTVSENIEYMVNSEKFDRKGIVPTKALIVVGESRTGKTYLAEKICGEINLRRAAKGLKPIKFVEINHTDLTQDIDKDFPASLKSLIALNLYVYGPCIFFLDEIHTLNLQIDGNTKMLADFLTTMSGFDDGINIPYLFIAATNKPELLDHALLQPGRFGKRIICKYPNQEERAICILRNFEKYNIPLNNPAYQPFIEELLLATEGRSHEEINKVFDNALQQTIIHGTPLSLKELERALDEEIYHILPQEKKLEKSEERFIAAQQAGKILAINLYQPHKIVTQATICPVKDRILETTGLPKNSGKNYTHHGDVFAFGTKDTVDILSCDEVFAECKVLLANTLAEEVLFGKHSTFNLDSYQKALEAMRKYVLKGLTNNDLPKERYAELQQQAYEQLKKCEEEVRADFITHKDRLERLTQFLLLAKTLKKDDIMMGLMSKQEFEKLQADVLQEVEKQKNAAAKNTKTIDEPAPQEAPVAVA
jgi:cell division protease FtsH